MFSGNEVSIILPWWFLLGNPPDKEFEVESLRDNGFYRFKYLNEFAQLKQSQNSKSNVSLSSLVNKFFPNLGTSLRDHALIEKYQLGHWFLRIAATRSSRIENWLIETEGDLFENFFSSLSPDEQIKIAQFLIKSEKDITMIQNLVNEISIPSSIKNNNYWGFYWIHVPWLISMKKGVLIDGYLIGPPKLFTPQIKKIYEKELRKNIESLRSNEVFNDFIETNSELEDYLNEFSLQFKQIGSKYDNELLFDDILIDQEEIFDQLEIFPPCMRYLIQEVKEKGYVKHNYRFQLGLYLKKLGMDVDSQLRYWYNSAVDNIGISFDQFEKRAGYIIRHIYGLEGSRTDYHVPKCNKNITDYFCLFSHINTKHLEHVLISLYKFDSDLEIDIISDLCSKHKSQSACSVTYKNLTGKNININHPLQWTRDFTKNTKSGNES